MTRRARIARIDALEAALRPPAEHEASRIDVQIVRLEEAAVKLERRIEEMVGDGDGAELLDSLFEEEREVLALRLSKLRDKIALLRAQQVDTPATAHRPPPRTESDLRAELHALVVELRSDPEATQDDAAPWQRRAAELVRTRRARLDAVVEALGRARDGILRYVTAVESLLERVDDDALWAGPDDELVAPPFADERQRAALRASASARALNDAWVDLRDLARQWPELWPIARRRDHRNIPLPQLARAMSGEDPSSSLRHRDGMRAVLREARDTAAASALWVAELRDAVRQAPPPGGLSGT